MDACRHAQRISERTVLLGLLLCLVSLASAQDSAKPGLRESLRLAEGWVDRRLVRYHFATTYELGPEEVRHGWPPTLCLAIRSFDVPVGHEAYAALGRFGRSMLYDNALAAIALTMRGKYKEAKGILATFQHLQNKDGSIGFSWNTDGDDFYNRSYLRTGAISWAGYAITFYQLKTRDKTYQPAAERIAAWVLKQQITDTRDRRCGLVTGGWGRWDTKTWEKIFPGRQPWCAMEHQIDTYFFLRDLGRATGRLKYLDAAARLRHATLKKLWSEQEGRFYTAVKREGVDKARALDASSWGAMFALAVGERKKAKRCLEYVEAHYRSQKDGVTGYRPYDGAIEDYPKIPDWGKVAMVWSEGSLGVAMAYLKIGARDKAEQIVKEMAKLQRPTGGLYYSNQELPDFIACPSAAGTCWQVMVLRAMASEEHRDSFWGPDPGRALETRGRL